MPLHRDNLRGEWGRNKRWDYWAILAGDLVVSGVYADVDYLGLADVWWVDLASGRAGGRGIATPLGLGLQLPDVPGSAPLRVKRRRFRLDITDDITANITDDITDDDHGHPHHGDVAGEGRRRGKARRHDRACLRGTSR